MTGTAPAELYTPIAAREQITIAPDFRPPDEQPAWRQDFPVDWPQDQYVERRDFMKFLVLTSFAMTVGQVWIAVENWMRRRRGVDEIRRIAALDEIAVGGTLVFSYPAAHDPCVLVRLGERDKAARIFDHMLATDPTLDHVRADYVVALLQWGAYERARELLDDVTARSRSASSAVTTSGLRRIDLLRVQVLTHDGRYRDAFDLLDDLGVRFPSDPDVALARARFDDERGRVNAADRGYARAGEVAPEREDIARLLATRADEQAPRAAVESEFRAHMLEAELDYVTRLAREIGTDELPGTAVWRRIHELRAGGMSFEEIISDPVRHLGEEGRPLQQ